MDQRNALTVDVEDYFHPSEVASSVAMDQWERLPSRVEASTERTLELLDRRGVKATFFILGWVAEHYPELVRRIAYAGHEIGCHSFNHNLVYELTPQEFREDTIRAVRAIKAACGVTPRAYRAPSYSVTKESFWALEILTDLGFTHDSSIYPINHDRYGVPGFSRHVQVMRTNAGPLVEVPIATVELSGGRMTPVGGGGYLRMLPYCYTAAGLRRINRQDKQPACVYFHPWEIDPQQPRIADGLLSRMRTYLGLNSMEKKLDRLMREFEFAPLMEVFPTQNRAARAAGTS